MTEHDLSVLRAELDAELAGPSPASAREHARRHAVVAAIVSEALRRNDMQAMVVGGSALEFHAPGAYETSDIDLVVAQSGLAPSRDALDRVFASLGFSKGTTRHWVRNDILIEVPGHEQDDPAEQHSIGPYRLTVVKKEVVLVGRMVEYDQTGHTGHAAQAVLMLRTFGDSLDQTLLDRLVRRERVQRAYATLRTFADRSPDMPITDEELRTARERFRSATSAEGANDAD